MFLTMQRKHPFLYFFLVLLASVDICFSADKSASSALTYGTAVKESESNVVVESSQSKKGQQPDNEQPTSSTLYKGVKGKKTDEKQKAESKLKSEKAKTKGKREKSKREERERLIPANVICGFERVQNLKEELGTFHHLVHNHLLFRPLMDETQSVILKTTTAMQHVGDAFRRLFSNSLSTLKYSLSLEVPYVAEDIKKDLLSQYEQLDSLFWSYDNKIMSAEAVSLLDKMKWGGRLPKPTITSSILYEKFKSIMEALIPQTKVLNAHTKNCKSINNYYRYSLEYTLLSPFPSLSHENVKSLLTNITTYMSIIVNLLEDVQMKKRTLNVDMMDELLLNKAKIMSLLNAPYEEIESVQLEMDMHLNKEKMKNESLVLCLIYNLHHFLDVRNSSMCSKLEGDIKDGSSNPFISELLTFFQREGLLVQDMIKTALLNFERLYGRKTFFHLTQAKSEKCIENNLQNVVKCYLRILSTKRFLNEVNGFLQSLTNYEQLVMPIMNYDSSKTVEHKDISVAATTEESEKAHSQSLEFQNLKYLYQRFLSYTDSILLQSYVNKELTRILFVSDKFQRSTRELQLYLSYAQRMCNMYKEADTKKRGKGQTGAESDLKTKCLNKIALTLWYATLVVKRGYKLLTYYT